MSIDFGKIREENIKRYGTDIDQYGPVLLANLYSNQTHFVFELLQNAEDAGATTVKFNLTHDSLTFEHDGRPFDEADVRGICGLVTGTKKDDLTKIGKFGIGFKSVYAHTNSPEIHCGDEHFTVRNYVQPYIVDSRRSELGTLFSFPFNRPNKDRDNSYKAIFRRLHNLKNDTMLFLKSINSIEYEVEGVGSGVYMRVPEEAYEGGFASRVSLLGQRNHEEDTEENWLLFKRDISRLTQSNNQSLFVEIAFRIQESHAEGTPQFAALSQSDLVVFFPTEKETKLGFLIQGPYKTTPARDNIPDDNQFNLMLVDETGELVVDALRWLRDQNWLSVDVLQTLPLAYRECLYSWSREEQIVRKYDRFFYSIYQKVKNALFTEALLPSSAGGYIAAGDAKIAGSASLRKLLNEAETKYLSGVNEETQWLSGEITPDRTPELMRYITTILGVEEIDTEKFVRRIDENFMKNQSDEWIRSFYKFAPSSRTIREILRDKPIIRLEDGSHVKPSHAYLPSDYDSRFSTVKPEVCASKGSLKFLKDMGLKKPDIVDEVLDYVLPKYNRKQQIDDAEHQSDINLIFQALKVDSNQRRVTIENALKNSRFLRGTSATGSDAFHKPGDLYFRNPTLEMYFEGNQDAWFLSSEYEQYHEELSDLGVADNVRIHCRRPNSAWETHIVIRRWHGDHERGLNGYDPDWKVDGLDQALNHPNLRRCEFIWNSILIPHKHLIQGKIESSTRQNYSFSKIESQVSATGKLLKESAWLPNKQGEFVPPSELKLDDLPKDFRPDEDLASALGMRITVETGIENLLNSDEISEGEKDLMRFALGLTEEERKMIEANREKKREKPETLEAEGYQSALQGSFNKSQSNSRKRPNFAGAPQHKSPDDRKIAAETDIDNEPNLKDRIQPTVSNKWEAKNPKTRAFLLNEYGGECQICGDTFLKRDGSRYFEAVHFIHRTKAKWLDHPRNALCLCATHSAQFRHGTVTTLDRDIIDNIRSAEEGLAHSIDILLCEDLQTVEFSADHIDELRSAIEVTDYF